MRPRKVILLVDADETHAGEMRFLLQVGIRYRVVVAHDAAAALALHDLGVDLVLGYADGMLDQWPLLLERMKARDVGVPVVLAMRRRELAAAWPADALLDARQSSAELLERIRTMIARRRGPRKAELVLAPALAGD